MRILFSTVCVGWIAFALVLANSAKASAATESFIEGKVESSGDCKKDSSAHVFLSSDKTLIFHNDIPVGGSFRFHVKEGKYDLAVFSPSHCIAIEKVSLDEKNPNPKFTLTLSNKRQPACMYGYCPNGVPETAPVNPMNWGNPWMLNWGTPPFWSIYASPYSNMGWPGPMQSYYVDPRHFWGGGNMAAAKPNLYMSATKKQKVDLAIEYVNKETRWLATIPAVQNDHWNIQVEPKKGLLVDKAKYKYIFYDYRGYDENLQNTSGFCDKRNAVLEKIAENLKNAKFSSNEVADFLEYWRIKMPPAEELCVFPQSEVELNKTALIISKPQPHRVIRRLFVVVPKDKGVFYGDTRFTREPASPWVPDSAEQTIKNFKSDLELREWGVAFLFHQ